MLKVRGEVKEILKVEEGVTKAGKNWSKRDFVILQEGKFPELLCITMFGDKMDLISRVGAGEIVDVGISLSSRDFNGKFYHNINGFSVDVVLDGGTADNGLQGLKAGDINLGSDDGDSLPF